VRRNPWVAVGVLALIAIQLLYTYAPVMNDVFGSAPLDPASWLLIGAVAVAAYGTVEIAKALHKNS
jgi:cation-transporting ATPase F